VFVAAMGLTMSSAGTWFLRTVGSRVQRKFRMRVGVALESHVAELQASVATIEHQERPEYLDRLAVLREQTFQLDHLYGAVFSTLGALLRLGITVVLLMSVQPLMGLLMLFAAPAPVFISERRAGKQQKVDEKAAPHNRMARHLFVLGTTASPGKEVRLTGIGPRLVEQRREAWSEWYAQVGRFRQMTGWWLTLGWAVFGAGYVAAVVFASTVIDASPGEILLVLAAGARLAQYVAMAAEETDFLRMWLDSARKLGWLERYANAQRERADLPVPDRIERDVRFDHVSFRYPGTDRLVLDDVTLELPAGKVVAIVGENGAGKTTLMKLLSRFYEPTEGTITVDGADLQRLPAEEWRSRMAGAYQDFFKFELVARQSVGVGDLDRLDDVPSVTTAVERGGGVDVVERLPAGLDTQLGPIWTDGVELSFGQWQKLALARGFMRDNPLLLVLDEPTAALDAETEHALFERFAEQSRAANNDGRITLLVSHRFSTVRMADLVVVLDGARVVEVGSHEELMARNGTYAELYGIQARAYR